MGTVGRQRIVLIDPVKQRRDEHAATLSRRFDVRAFDSCGPAVASLNDSEPVHVVVANIRQSEGNGLDAAATLRKMVGKSAFICVLGPPDRPVTADQRDGIARRLGVDRWLTRNIDSSDLDALIASRVRPAAPADRFPAPVGGTASAALEKPAERAERPIAPAESWFDRLRARTSRSPSGA